MRTGFVLMAIGAAELRLSLNTVHLEYADTKTVAAGVAYALVRAASRLISTHGSPALTSAYATPMAAAKPNELVLETTEQHSDGRRLERRLMLEKQ